MIFPVLFLVAIYIGLTSSIKDELLRRHNLANDVSLQHFSNNSNSSEKLTSNLNSETEILRHVYKNTPSLESSSIIFGLSKIANKSILNEQCFKDLKAIESGILRNEPWAMKVLDSSGGKESGFIWGHNYWLGSAHGCAAVKDPVRLTLSGRFERTMKEGLINQMAPFKMDYRVVYMKHNSPWQVEIKLMPERIIHVGLCLPSACSLSEIKNMTQTLMDDNKLEESRILDLHADVMYVKDLKLKDSFFKQKSLKITAICVFFTLAMTIVAWLVGNTKLFKLESTSSKLFLLIRCFDVTKNAQELFTFNESASNWISIINGLRSVSCFWVLMSHVSLYMYFTLNNKAFLIAYSEQPLFQFVSISPLIVDLLFSISGFLQTYIFIKDEKQLDEIRVSTFGQNAKAFGRMALYRYLRLAPLYLVISVMVPLVTSYIEDVSVFHISDRYDQVCSKYWWRNILFIQNFFHWSELCLNWSWSLACEMQYSLLVQGLLFAYAKHPKTVKKLAVTGVIASIVWSYIMAVKHQYQFSFDVFLNSSIDMYINPFIRITPYLVGSMGGYYLAKSKGNLKISSVTEKYIWNLAALVFVACVYSNLKRDLPPFYSITILVASRISIAMVVCWMIIASTGGRGTWWSRILECKIFRHTHRLSYAIYLLNPFIIGLVFSLSNSSSSMDPVQLCLLVSGFGVINYLASILFSLAFEIPYCKLSKMLLKKTTKIT